MVNRIYKLTSLIIFLFSGFSASGRGGLYHIGHKSVKKTFFLATNPQHNPFNYEYNINNAPNPVINILQHRGAHSIHNFYHCPNFYSAGIKYMNFICGRGTSELSRFRKLILFPFHAFW